MNTQLKKSGEEFCNCSKRNALTQNEAGATDGGRNAMSPEAGSEPCVNFTVVGRISQAIEGETIAESMPTRRTNKNMIEYVMTAIIEFSKRHRLTIREASNYLNRFKGIDFLTEFYDVEHTLSFNDCVDDLTVVCQNHGGAIR